MNESKELYKYCSLSNDDPFYEEVLVLHKKAVENEESTYIDPKTGFIVFSALYHIQRGSCCGNGCRHCPYEKPAK